MSWTGMLKRRVAAMLPALLFLSLVGYFGWNATQGDRGLQSFALRQKQLVQVQGELARAIAEREIWERRVAGLRTQRLDPDTLDERARAMLTVADPAELVVPYGPGRRVF